jgi:hypothetical protein
MNRFDRMHFLLEKRNMTHEKLLNDLIEKLDEETAIELFESIETMNGIEPPDTDYDGVWYEDNWDQESTKY